MKNREAKLIPKWINLRIQENKISIEYDIMDSLSNVHLDKVYINFTPSEELMKVFEKEIEVAIKNHKR